MFSKLVRQLPLLIISLILLSCTVKVVDIADRMSDQMMKTDVPFDELDNVSKAKRDGKDNITSPSYSDKNEIQIYGVYIENKRQTKEINSEDDYKNALKKVKTKYQLQNGYPEWFYFKDIVGYTYIAIGSSEADASGFEVQKNNAISKAKKELEKKVRVLVDNEYNIRSINSGALIYKSTQAKKAREKTEEIVSKFVLVDEWLNPSNLDYYILIGIVDEGFDNNSDTEVKSNNKTNID